MKGIKKTLAMLLALAMVMTSLTVTAFGADYVAELKNQNGTKQYTTVADAVAAATTAATKQTQHIKLLADATISKQLSFGKGTSENASTLYFDFNGHKLSSTAKLTSYFTHPSSYYDSYVFFDSSPEHNGGIYDTKGSTNAFTCNGWTGRGAGFRIKVNSGVYTGVTKIWNSNDTSVRILGGTFCADPTAGVTTAQSKEAANTTIQKVGSNWVVTSDTEVLYNGESYCSTFANAKTLGGGYSREVRLCKDLSSVPAAIFTNTSGNGVLNLNEHTLTVSGQLRLDNSGRNWTVKNGSITGWSTGSSAFGAGNNTTVTLDSVNISKSYGIATSPTSASSGTPTAKVIINSGNYTNIQFLASINYMGNDSITINGGTFAPTNASPFQKCVINGGKFAPTTTSTLKFEKCTINGGVFTKPVSQDACGTGYYATTDLADAEDADYPYTVVDEETYTVSYDGYVGADTTAHGTKTELPSSLDIEGCTLIGWALEDGATEADFEPGDEVEFSKDTSLYPVISATIKYFDEEGNELTDLADEVIIGEEVTFPTGPVAAPKVFACWKLDGDEVNSYFADDKLLIEEEKEYDFTAVYSEPATVTFYNGENVFDTITSAVGGSVTAPDGPEKAGYVFKYWEVEGGDGTQYEPEDIIPVKTEVVTVNAVFNELFDFTFDGGDPETAEENVEFELPTLDDDNTNLKGVFAGWKDQDGNTYEGGEKITPEDDMTFTSLWEDYAVEANIDGGTSTYFKNLQDAVDTVAAKAGTTRTNYILHDDLVVSTTVYFSEKHTYSDASDATARKSYLDLNGHSITATEEFTLGLNCATLFLQNRYGSLTIEDNSEDGTGSVNIPEGNKNIQNFSYHPNWGSQKFTITGGTFNGNIPLVSQSFIATAITGGTFNLSKPADNMGISVSGGTFTYDPTVDLAAGYYAKANDDNTWTVIEMDPVAEITVGDVTTQYPSLQEAVTAARGIENATIKVIDDIELNEALLASYANSVGKVMTIDLNGKTITCTKNFIGTFGILHITDSVGTGVVKYVGDLTESGITSANPSYGYNFISLRYWNGTDCPAGTIYIEGGTIKDESANGHPFAMVGATTGAYSYIYFNGGKIIAKEGHKAVIENSGYGTYNGTEIIGDVYVNDGTFNFNDGKIEGTISKGGGTLNFAGGQYSVDPTSIASSITKGYHFEMNEDEFYELVENANTVEVTVDGVPTGYKTFTEAWAAANVAGQEATIKLLDNVILDGAKETKADKIILDLNGFTLSEASTRLFDVKGGTELDVVDNSAAGNGQLIDSSTTAQKNGAIIVYGTFKALGGTIKTTATSGAWVTEEVICAYSGSPTVIIDGATISNACTTKPAIGIHAGTFNFISGSVEGGILNLNDVNTVTGDFAAKTQKAGSDDVTYYTTLNDARRRAVYYTQDASEINVTLLADASVSSRVDFMTAWNESAARKVNFDFNGYKITATKTLSTSVLGINTAGKVVVNDSVGTGGIDACGSPLFYSCGYAANFTINGGTYINVTTGEKKIGSNYVNKDDIRVCGGTYSFDVSDNVYSKDDFAYDNGNDTWTVKHKLYMVTIGEESTYAPYIASAVDMILATPSKAGTIKPIESLTLDDVICIDDVDANIIIDLGGKTVAPAEGKAFADVTAGSLAITNGEIDFTGCGEEAYILVAKDQTLEMNNITFTGSLVFVKSSGTVLIDNAITTTGVVLQEESSVTFYTIGASIADDVKFSFVVNAALIEAEEGSSVQLQYTVDTYVDGEAGRETIVIDPTDTTNGQYTFDFTEGLPQWSVNSDLELNVLVNGESKLAKAYTLQDYYNTLNAYFPEETLLNTLTANQIKFAEELQKKAFGSSEIEYAGWEDEFISVAEPTEEDNVKKHVDTTGYKQGESQIASATVNVTDKIALTYKIYYPLDGAVLNVFNENSDTVPVEDGEARAATPDHPWYVYQSKISPVDYDETYTVTLKDADGNMIHAITYSVNSYCYSMLNVGAQSNQTKAVAMALYRYGVAAAAFATENDPAAEHTYTEPTYEWSPYYLECTATRTCNETGEVQSETAVATKTVVKEAEGVYGEEYTMTARFANPAFRTQVQYCGPDAKETGIVADDSQKVIAKHLLTDAGGNYGGTLDADLYGAGAPLNGALDQVVGEDFVSDYYRINDFYNAGNSDTRILVPEFAPYQQTMANSDGVASALMVMNYCGDEVTELGLVSEYESLNSETIYGNGTTSAGLAALFEAHEYTATADCFTGSSSADFGSWIKQNLANNKFILIRYQSSFLDHWRVIIGYDECGTTDVSDDVVIMANPYDAFDHYQDGYTVEAMPYIYRWWLTVQLEDKGEAGYDTTFPKKNIQSCVVVEAKQPIEYVTPAVDMLITERNVPERHQMLNGDGSFGGTLNTVDYGGGTRRNAYTQDATSGRYVSIEHFDMNYFAFPDYYNMDDSGSRIFLHNYRAHQQLMASSCGINSTMQAMDWLGFDFNNIYPKLNDTQKEQATLDLSEIDDTYGNDKKEEAFLRYYMQVNKPFKDDPTKKFNNYGGVDPSTLMNVPSAFGFSIELYGNHNFSNVKMDTYDAFVERMTKYLKQDLPIVVCWNPTGGHYETVIGYDGMGTDDPYDDVIVLADSADAKDHYVDGYNTFPAMQFYSRFFNGGWGLAQMLLVIKPK